MSAPILKMRACRNFRLFPHIRRFTKRKSLSTLANSRILDVLQGKGENEDEIEVQGWIRSIRAQKEYGFLHINDGSTATNLQVVTKPEQMEGLSYGSYVTVKGQVVPSPKRGQKYELVAGDLQLVGACTAADFPFMARKSHTLEYAREYPHLRPKMAQFASLLRLRSITTHAIHKYFQDEGYVQIHTPVITSNDCEGAGEVFRVEADKTFQPTPDVTVTDPNSSNSDHFFNTPAFLTVSGQLHLEAMAGAFDRVYTFGPTFRAEHSKTRHHLAEFYMVEAELAGTKSLECILKVIEDLLKASTENILKLGENDIQHFCSNEHKSKVCDIIFQEFNRLTYTEAVNILENKNKKFENPVKWGDDFMKEHETFLVKHCGNRPVFITDWPATLKPFYARVNEDQNTVSAVDLLMPDVGELFGGSLREERLDVLEEKLDQLKSRESLEWYIDLRRFGSAPHGGFGMGFERYLQFILGVSNIRDTLPFPRIFRNCPM